MPPGVYLHILTLWIPPHPPPPRGGGLKRGTEKTRILGHQRVFRVLEKPPRNQVYHQYTGGFQGVFRGFGGILLDMLTFLVTQTIKYYFFLYSLLILSHNTLNHNTTSPLIVILCGRRGSVVSSEQRSLLIEIDILFLGVILFSYSSSLCGGFPLLLYEE